MKHCGATEMLQPTNHTLQIYESWFVWYWPKQKAHHPRFSIFSWKWSMKWESPPKSWVISHSPVKGYNVGCLLTVSVSMFQFVTVTVCVLHWHFYKTCHISFTCLWPHFHCSGGDGRRLWGGGHLLQCSWGHAGGWPKVLFLTPTKMFWCLNLTNTQAQCGHKIKLNLT